MADVTKGEPVDKYRHGTSFIGGKPRWHWMEIAEGQLRGGDAPKDYYPKPETDKRYTRMCGTDCKEGSTREDTPDMFVRLDVTPSDMTVSQEAWDKGCAETEDEQEVVLSYSGGLVKYSGTIGSDAWHAKGCPLAYSHREYPGTYALSSVRIELLHTLRCLNIIRSHG